MNNKMKIKPIEDNDFLFSVETMTQDDIVLNETAKKVKKAPFDYLRYIVLIFCVAVFIYSGYNIVEKFISYAEAANDHDTLLSMFYGSTSNSDDGKFLQKTMQNTPIEDLLQMQKQNGNQDVGAQVVAGVSEADQKILDLKSFIDINEDTYGWIRVSGTKVDYPIVQGSDNSYYLSRNFWKKYQASGSIFCDYRNSKDVSQNLNTIIYGHNMADTSMFSTLMNYWNHQDVFDSGIIELVTEKAIYRYEVFSVHQEVETYPYIEVGFGSGYNFATFTDFVNEMNSRSKYQKDGIELNNDTPIITLSTCTNTWRNPRLVVQGVLVEVVTK